MKWTDDQQKVIDLRNRNILVSAAAGSGKTAVLVERIITMITDEHKPVDIDRLLVVTFTKAAAREMKDRISKAIEKKLMDNPSDANLQKQSILVRSAHITTIDSFCLNIVKNYFSEIDLNPGFRIADENELSLIKAEIIEEVLEEYYEEGSYAFHQMIENYAGSRSDKNIEDMVLNLYNCSTSYPWPIEWLEQIKEGYNVEDFRTLETNQWIEKFEDFLKAMVRDLIYNTEGALKICQGEGGPIQYVDNIKADIDMYYNIEGKSSYYELYEAFRNVEYTTLSRKRSDCDEIQKNRVKAIRDNCKKSIQNIKKKYFFQSPSEMLQDMQHSKESMITLIDITIEFYKRFAKEKENLNILDFSDIEHFALNILVEAGTEEQTKVAKTLSNYYEEIMIDEYQDSNYVQETILNNISKIKQGQPNVFMVGDVKQSIYKFRMAKPELFLSKYKSYSSKDSEFQKIDLCQNFRSRDCVVDGTNTIFEKIMTEQLGGIVYDSKARLYSGATYLDGDNTAKNCELMLIDTDTDDIIDDYYSDLEDGVLGEVELLDLSKKEKEAKTIAKRIKELIFGDEPLMVQDKDNEGNVYLRNVMYKDIVILLRGLNGWSETLMDVFAKEGIPLNVETRTGYFSATEIRLTINMLKVINNPRQDIPLVAVLKSVIGGLSNEEIAIIRTKSKSRDYYDALTEYAAHFDNELTVKAKAFLYKLDYFRNLVPFTPIHELIQKVLADTGYYNYIYANADGDRRRMNLDMLVEKAIAYEKTSYKGLFNFIRFIEKMVKFDIDFGEASALGTDDNYVRVMTIHKSKGLEFPVVFVAGMGTKFNMQDTRDKIIIHPDMGVAPDYVDSKLRIKCPTLMKNVVANVIKEETIAEELRVLYVALTRAREKLILSGTISNVSKKLEAYSIIFASSTKAFNYERIVSASNYLDLVVTALIDNKGFTEILNDYGISQDRLDVEARKWDINIRTYKDLISDELIDDITKLITKEDMLKWESKKVYSEGLLNEIEQEDNFTYRYEEEIDMKGKFSITELKRMEQADIIEPLEEEILFTFDEEDEKESKVPKFIKGDEKIKANERGNAYHKVMEVLEVENINTLDDVKEQVNDIYLAGYITKEQYECIDNYSIHTFVQSNLGQRVKNAKSNNSLYREQQFVLGKKASEIYNRSKVSDENILFQGIIDMFFEEDGELVLVDYKTDRVKKKDGEEVLIERYKVQLDYYRQALEQLTKKKVKEVYIYSFALGKEIRIC
ncbi:MAG: helicase-exonuclease AddAB subunit AddA [Lachnospiraceae bacterium]|nr:helicase-exonuclease AddAB subunit AddA [Lachnospiraceae bacterium]